MSDLIVTIYDEPDRAMQVRESISRQERGGYISLDDSAVVVKDEQGKIHVRNQVDRGVKVGAVGGGLLGLLIGGLLFPFAGLLIGAVGGAVVGHFMDKGVDQDFVRDVSQELKPGGSALFIIVRNQDPGQVIAVLQQYKGKVLQTTLDSQSEEALRRGMK
jgi:uncharacterized membrane protein